MAANTSPDTETSAARRRATLIGFGAVLLWSTLALATVLSRPVPPFQLTALAFAIGGCIGLIWAAARGRLHVLRRVPLPALMFGTAGLFGYHALYFAALRLAPPAQAGLIAYLWPLLIVLLSGLLPGEHLTLRHVAGAALAFAGAALIIAGDGGGEGAASALGYGLAAVAALVWAVYSLGSRRLAAVPTEAVALCCLATAVLSTVMHLGWETSVWPVSVTGWAAVVALGLGPVGAAFMLWDVGVKRGDIQVLGTAAYAAPVLSTALLMLTGQAEARPVLILSAALIAGGAALAATGSWRTGRSLP